MCGRFAFYSPAEATAALFGATTEVEVKPRYNIAPTQDIAAVRDSDDGGRELVMLRWGLVPFWAKDPSIGNRMINARAETVAEKPSYRAAYRHRRCLVLADGFYEWQRKNDHKTP
ncbi:MAG: SOS response-associated peptidase, partial [Gammaproteobacteria bacterium]|nr:SOS response-associated peptidase [Gammaproteobacteria bacterium]